jgi:thiol-disulfide isomerase/thioredoxin
MNHIKKATGMLFLLAIVSISSLAETTAFKSSKCTKPTFILMGKYSVENVFDRLKKNAALIPFGEHNNKTDEKIDPILIFNQVNKRLTSLKTVKYHYSQEFNYPDEGYVAKDEGDIYIEFDKKHDLSGMRFQYRDERGFIIFNNSELFTVNKKTQTIELSHIKSDSDLESKSPLYNSIVTLKNIFPILLKDQGIQKSVTDTLIDKKSFYSLRFFLHNKLINYVGRDFTKVTNELTFSYQIIVDKCTLMPQTILQTTLNSQNLNRTDFSAIETSPALVGESSWFYSNYFDSYKLEDPKVPVVLIKNGEPAPNWELTNYTSDAKETLEQHKGKLVLLEFWIKNCGYCIEAVPKLNAINNDYRNNDFKLLAINTVDNRNNIEVFLAKHPINYTVIYGDNPLINKSYGIAGFPQVVLIAKNGTVLYSGNFDIKTLRQLINKNL